MSKTRKTLEDLHSALAEILMTEIKQRRTDPETGEDLGPNIAALNIARQFLKDNHIEAVTEKKNPLDSLASAALPFMQEDMGQTRRH